ncbi:MAG TPA: class I SAM-dependent methyltransferase [Candidatus Omnitrophota bacterium]|nr:class I SAM-dependent methyltransferase [Candidatus Omnitrophota bacterium]
MASEIRPFMVEVFGKLGDNRVGVEIGTHLGYNAIATVLVNRPKILHCIDPWSNYVDPDSLDVIGEAQYLRAMHLINVVPFVRDHIQIWRMVSEHAVKSFADESVDFVYIDGDHSYHSTLQDIDIWFPKVKKGGIIGGHDFAIPTVQAAVTAYSHVKNIKFTQVLEDWWFNK